LAVSSSFPGNRPSPWSFVVSLYPWSRYFLLFVSYSCPLSNIRLGLCRSFTLCFGILRLCVAFCACLHDADLISPFSLTRASPPPITPSPDGVVIFFARLLVCFVGSHQLLPPAPCPSPLVLNPFHRCQSPHFLGQQLDFTDPSNPAHPFFLTVVHFLAAFRLSLAEKARSLSLCIAQFTFFIMSLVLQRSDLAPAVSGPSSSTYVSSRWPPFLFLSPSSTICSSYPLLPCGWRARPSTPCHESASLLFVLR